MVVVGEREREQTFTHYTVYFVFMSEWLRVGLHAEVHIRELKKKESGKNVISTLPLVAFLKTSNKKVFSEMPLVAFP